MRIAQDFDRVLELVAELPHEMTIELTGINLYLEDARRTSDLHGQQQTGPYAVSALAVVDVDEAVGGVDRRHQPSKRR